jgi:hypothetical protein
VSRHPMEGRTVTGWWGILTKYNDLSKVHAMRAFADANLSVRGDKDECTVVEVEVVIKRVVREMKKNGRRS